MTNDNPDASRTAYYEQIAAKRMTPLWESLHSLVPKPSAQSAACDSGNTRR